MPRYTPIRATEGILRINGYDFPAYMMVTEQDSPNIRVRTASSFPFTDERPSNSRFAVVSASGYCKSDFNPFVRTTIFLDSYVDLTLIFKENNTEANYPSVLVTHWKYECNVNQTANWEFQGVANYQFQNFGRTNL